RVSDQIETYIPFVSTSRNFPLHQFTFPNEFKGEIGPTSAGGVNREKKTTKLPVWSPTFRRLVT
ncbi:hypothetical protein LINPERPRIM_LOCUS41644, partial [Linum perenne]